MKEKIEYYLNHNTVEGYYTLESSHQLLHHRGINIELIDLIYDIICGKLEVDELLKFIVEK